MTGFHSDSSRVKVSESHVPDRLLQRFRQKWLASVVGVCAFCCCCCVFCFIHFLMSQLVCCNAIAVFSVSLLQTEWYKHVSECAPNSYGENCAQQCTCTSNAQSCNNVNGACSCKAGWDGTRCEIDVNECMTNQHNCSGDHVICINEDGGYSCGCELGYKYNGSNVCLGQCRFFRDTFTMVV